MAREAGGPPSWRGASGLAVPFKRALFEGVDIADEEDSEERHHASEDEIGILGQHVAVNGRPWVEEYHFDIEEDEQHGHEVEADSHPGYAGALGQHTAFVGCVLDLGSAANFPEEDGEAEHAAGETEREQHQHEDWYILA